MEVLPAGFSDFRNREYWNNFFRSFDKKNFEWYGNYGDIKKIVHECIRRRFNYCDSALKCSSMKREILNKNCLLINAGCGNSNVSYEFFQDGFEYIVNIDYSEVVIEKMKNKYGKIMEFINIDVSNTDKFDTLLTNLEKERLKRKKEYKLFFDKAFLDAYISCEKNEEDICKKNAKNYFSIILKHLNEGDIFLIITLAQYYITKEIVRNIYDKNVMLEVFPFLLNNNSSEFKYHPFLFAFYKNEKNIKDYTVKFTHLGNKTTNDISLWKLPQEINNTRECVNLHTFRMGKRVTLDIFNRNVNECHYNVIVYDSSNDIIKYNTVVIVVPFGYEFHWLYSTPEGNEQLATQAGAKRLLLVMRSNFGGKSGTVGVGLTVVHNDKRENLTSLCPENDLNNGLNGIGTKQISGHGVNEHFVEREEGKEKRNNNNNNNNN
ncbi:S-adenosyl-L-methionine-dependent methyltransferase, putative, partial [Plasmodium ovale curtisi]